MLLIAWGPLQYDLESEKKSMIHRACLKEHADILCRERAFLFACVCWGVLRFASRVFPPMLTYCCFDYGIGHTHGDWTCSRCTEDCLCMMCVGRTVPTCPAIGVVLQEHLLQFVNSAAVQVLRMRCIVSISWVKDQIPQWSRRNGVVDFPVHGAMDLHICRGIRGVQFDLALKRVRLNLMLSK